MYTQAQITKSSSKNPSLSWARKSLHRHISKVLKGVSSYLCPGGAHSKFNMKIPPLLFLLPTPGTLTCLLPSHSSRAGSSSCKMPTCLGIWRAPTPPDPMQDGGEKPMALPCAPSDQCVPSPALQPFVSTYTYQGTPRPCANPPAFLGCVPRLLCSSREFLLRRPVSFS